MGTWASDNFGNDGACDFRADVIDYLLNTAKAPEDFLEIDEVMAAVAIMVAICERCGVPGNLQEFDVESLRRSVVAVFDAEIDDYCPKPAHKRDRREVINRTFDELQLHLSA